MFGGLGDECQQMEGCGIVGWLERALRPKPHRDPRGTSIDDWRWRSTPRVREDLAGLDGVPPHVVEFGQHMDWTADRAAGEGLIARDLLIAYMITRSSIQRQSRDADRVRARRLELPPDVTGPIRPEGAWAEWLMSPMGQRYLNSAERAEVDREALGS